jgi:signal transduction histidine kinase
MPLRDMLTGAIELVSVDSSGAAANGNSALSGISGDGCFVAFSSFATTGARGTTRRGPRSSSASDRPATGSVARQRVCDLRAELRAAIAELSALARGLYPPALVRADLAGALEEMARRAAVPTAIGISGDLRTLSDDARATAWFVCAEAFANVARHARASQATIALRLDPKLLTIEICGDGRGGATPTRGLRGLADRIESRGGTLAVNSPAGGPTTIRAEIPT